MSVAGEGSTFWVEFEFAGKLDAAVEAEAAHDRMPQARRNLVIHIEDNPTNQRLIRQIFASRKALALREAIDAETGVEMVRELLPSLVLMDINLPGMDGYAALKLLKADPLTAHIPVIAISANAMKGEEERGIAAGFSAYVTKPLDVRQLLAMIDEMVGE